MARTPLSVAMVCQNEEDRIGQALASVAFADEIVVVDSGSTDSTLEIVSKYTDKIHRREWRGWKDQKKWAADQCSHEWVLTLDADEIVSDRLRESILRALSRPEIPENGFTLSRMTFYLGRWIKHGGWYPDRKLRLYKKPVAVFGGDDPHEIIQVPEPTGELEGDLLHYTYRNFSHHASQMVRYALVNAEARHVQGARAGFADLFFRPSFAFIKSYLFKLGLVEGMPGLVIASMIAYYTFMKYARLWELSREK